MPYALRHRKNIIFIAACALSAATSAFAAEPPAAPPVDADTIQAWHFDESQGDSTSSTGGKQKANVSGGYS